MKEKLFAIVVPVYKKILDPIEELSLKRMCELLSGKNYDIYLICPKTLDLSNYYNIIDNNMQVKESRLDDDNFKDIHAYSQLCLKYDFYSLFKEYSYIYIYQLDVYLREDHLEEFCKLGYDYIGSPVVSTDCGWSTLKKDDDGNVISYAPVIGNGGFSLRKVSTFMDITDPEGEFRKYYEITDDILKDIQFEDLYFCECVKNFYYTNIAPLDVGKEFCWDMSADVLYNQFGYDKFPMAIHAWDKNIRFWQKYIPELESARNYCEEKHKEFFKIYYDENDSSYRE